MGKHRKELPHGTIVPSQLPILPKGRHGKLVTSFGDPPPIEDNPVSPVTTPCCESVCEPTIGGRMGVVVCYDGTMIVAKDYPTDGGPWIPAFTAAGSLVWVNGGGI